MATTFACGAVLQCLGAAPKNYTEKDYWFSMLCALGTQQASLDAQAAAAAVAASPTFYTDENGNVLTVKRASVTLANNTANNAVVAIVATKKIRVIQYVLAASGTAVTVQFRSKPAGTGTDLPPLLSLPATGTLAVPRNNMGYYETVAGEALTATTSNGSAVAAQIFYVEV